MSVREQLAKIASLGLSAKKDNAAGVSPEATKEQPHPVTIDDFKVVDVDELLKLVYAVCNGQAEHYQGVAGVRRFAKIFGAIEYRDQLEMWNKIKTYIYEKRKARSDESKNEAPSAGA